MIQTMEQLRVVASRYALPTEDLFLLSLNLSGVKTDVGYGRIRFALTLNRNPAFSLSERLSISDYYLAIPVRDDSPFVLRDGELVFDGVVLAEALGATEDLCDTNYPRRYGTVMNLNPNRRTSCQGCKFCYTGYQVPNDQEQLLSEPSLRCFFVRWMAEQGCPDLSHLEQIAVVTGCFRDEEETLAFLLLLRGVAKTLGFRGEILYLGSQLSSAAALEAMVSIQPFVYCISLECFENRDTLVRDKKRMMGIGNVQRVLEMCADQGHLATFTYILGLDSFSAVTTGFAELAHRVSRFPIVNLLQTHRHQKGLRHPEAEDLAYYLETRLCLERIFGGTNLRPRPWENYRGLWYLKYGQTHLTDVRMPWANPPVAVKG